MRRFYRIVGNYLAIYAWRHSADCVRISGWHLKELLGLQRFRTDTSRCFGEDIRCWFPHSYPSWTHKPGFLAKGSRALRRMYVSRVPITFTSGKPDPNIRIVDFREEPDVELTESGMLTQLTLFASGLKAPQEVESSQHT
jgi:hypothetical protein